MRPIVILIALFVCTLARAGKLPTGDVQLAPHRPAWDEVRSQKPFGLGLSAGGALAVMGVELDVNLDDSWSVTAGVGTGLDYSTATVKARYALVSHWISPYLALGIARWWTAGTKETVFTPSLLNERFLRNETDFSRGFSLFLAYPAVGVQLLHPRGVDVYFEADYLTKLFDFSGGLRMGLGVHWYF